MLRTGLLLAHRYQPLQKVWRDPCEWALRLQRLQFVVERAAQSQRTQQLQSCLETSLDPVASSSAQHSESLVVR